MKSIKKRNRKKSQSQAFQCVPLLKQAKAGDSRALARLLSLAEESLVDLIPFISKLKIGSQSVRIGFTGPPGAGKSSLINLFIQHYRKKGLSVAVLAVDPSSPFSGGAVLGDRVRMREHFLDKNVFIRSIGSRGALGGISGPTGTMARILGYCGFDVVIIETVGVGQNELDVMNVTDVTAVVLVPESGDVIQTMKAGILEIADVFVINKADRPGADLLARELESFVELEGFSKIPLFLTSTQNATQPQIDTHGDDIQRVADTVLDLARKMKTDSHRQSRKRVGELRSLLLLSFNEKVRECMKDLKVSDPLKGFLLLRKKLRS